MAETIINVPVPTRIISMENLNHYNFRPSILAYTRIIFKINHSSSYVMLDLIIIRLAYSEFSSIVSCIESKTIP